MMSKKNPPKKNPPKKNPPKKNPPMQGMAGLIVCGFDRRLQPPAKTAQEQPVVEPQVSHFRQVPLRTSVKLAHSGQLSPT